jgi:hypothetical protein
MVPLGLNVSVAFDVPLKVFDPTSAPLNALVGPPAAPRLVNPIIPTAASS